MVSREVRLLVTVLGALMFAILAGGAAHASAAVYWANWNTIAGANLDGSNLDPSYISSFDQSSIGGACGVAVDASYIYWADTMLNQIGRANLDGTEPIYNFITGADEPCGVAVDSGFVYWANRGGDSIGRANLDGSFAEQRFVGGVKQPCGVAVNHFFVYWASPWEGSIGRALVGNGGIPRNNFIKDIEGSCGVAVNGTHLFWGSYASSIGRADLDGTNPVPELVSGLDRPCGVAVNQSGIFWTEESIGARGLVGSANLDGTDVNRGLVTGLRLPCGVAVDGQPFPLDRGAHLPSSEFGFGKVKHARNQREPVTFLAVDVPLPGAYRVEVPPGVGWNGLGSEPWDGRYMSGGRKWLSIWLKNTRSGKRLQRKIRNKGRIRVPVTFHFTAPDHNETGKWRMVSLVRGRSR